MSRFSKVAVAKQIFEALSANQKRRPRLSATMVQNTIEHFLGHVGRSLATTGRANVVGFGNFAVQKKNGEIRFKAANNFAIRAFPGDQQVDVSGVAASKVGAVAAEAEAKDAAAANSST